MDYIENKTFDEIEVGDSASLSRTLKPEDIKLFAVMSGDVNPAHVDEEFARSDMFHKIIAHGMWGGALISTLLGTKLPGPGTIYLGQTLKFTKPVALGDTVTVTATVSNKDPEKHRVAFDCCCKNQKGDVVISGSAQVDRADRKGKAAARRPSRSSPVRSRGPFSRTDQADDEVLPPCAWQLCIRSMATRSAERSTRHKRR